MRVVRCEVDVLLLALLSPDLSSRPPLFSSLFLLPLPRQRPRSFSPREPPETPTALFRAIHTPEKDLCRGRAIILECSLGIATSTICVPLSPLFSSLLSSCSPSFAPSSDPPILPSPFHPPIHTCTTPVHAFTQTTTTTPISPSRRRHLRRGTPGNTQSIS